MVNIFQKTSVHKSGSQGSKAYSEETLFPILPLNKLLPEKEKNSYLNKIQEVVALPEEHCHILYEDLIDRFSLFVQTLPERYGEELGGLLHDGLRRALLAIQILTQGKADKPHPLYVFAVFSIALLSDLGQILNYRIMISDDQGIFIDEWYPYLGPMNEFGEYFKLRPYDSSLSLVRNVTPLLARQLLNDTAITWLSSNNQIFDMWLAFLNKGEDWTGGLGQILKIEKKDFDQKKRFLPLLPVDIDLLNPSGTELAEAFLAWLKKGLQDGTISLNQPDSHVHVIKSSDVALGLFLQAPELFQQFANVYPKSEAWVVVCKQFNFLGLTKLSGEDVKFEQFFAETGEGKDKLGFLGKEKSKQKLSLQEHALMTSRVITTANNIKEGIVVKDARILFGANVPPVSQFLRDIEMRWSLDNSLPKIRQTVAVAPQVKPEGGFRG